MDKVLLSSSKYIPHKAYWKQFLSSHPQGFAFTQNQSSSNGARRFQHLSFSLDQEKTAPVFELVNGNDMGIFVSLLSVIGALLYKYTEEAAVIVNTPLLLSQKDKKRYTDHVPLLLSPDETQSWQEYLVATQKRVKEAYAYQNFPLNLLQEETSDEDLYRSNVLMAFDGIHMAVEDRELYDLLIQVGRKDNTVEISITYNAHGFDEYFIKSIKGHLETLLSQLITPSATIGESDYLSVAEKEQILIGFNGKILPYQREKSIIDLFEIQAALHPDAKAVGYNNQALSYRELSERSNQLARHLHNEMGVRPGDAVGLMVDRSERMIIGLMSIMKLGATYVPIDAAHMAEHAGNIFEEADLKVLLLDSTYMFNISGFEKPAFVLDYQLDQLEESKELFNQGYQDDSLAYIIYTSGSTGKRKGVMVTYGSLHNLCSWYLERYQMDASSSVLLMVPFGFDASIKNMIAPLMAGGSVVISPAGNYDPETIAALVATEQVTQINCVPTAFLPVLQHAERSGYDSLRSLKWLAFGGEQLNIKPFLDWTTHKACQVTITNVYGPTEGVDSCTVYEVPAAKEEQPTKIPIGKPVPNVEVYLLNKALNPVPVGIKGEIFLGGLGVAKGYLASPELTAEKFVENPFSGTDEEKLYRTGDIARWNEDGNIEFLGRVDDQLKIGGIRIEPGEIEHALQQHSVIREAYIQVDNENEEKSLTAVLKLDSHATPVFKIMKTLKERPELQSSLYRFPNGLMAFHINKTETDFIYNEVFEDQCYLRHGIRMNPGDVIFDVGANIGMFSLFSALHFKDVEVYAFEPMPEVYSMLKANAAMYSSNIHTFNMGISNEEGVATFTYYPNNTALSGRYGDEIDDKRILRTTLINQLQESGSAVDEQHINDVLDARISGQEVQCKLTSISHVIRKNNIKRIDYLKVDVERSELNVLEGIEKEHWPMIQQVVIEVHDVDGRLNIIKLLLEKHGFTVYTKEEDLLKGTGLYNLYATRNTENANKDRQHQDPVLFNYPGGQWTSRKDLIKNIRSFCVDRLPAYMIPSKFEIAEAIPLTANGKVDRKKLSENGQIDYEPELSTVAPRNDTETQLVAIWERIMGKSPIGIKDDFFELGGHSLTALRITHLIYDEMSANVGLNTVFMYRTIEELAPEVEKAKQETDHYALAPEGREFYDVSHAQKRLWVIHQFKESEAAYHMPAAYSLRDIDVRALEQAFYTLVERHESLRTTFVTVDGEPKQKVHLPGEFNFKVERSDLRNKPDQEQLILSITQKVVNNPFDLENGPLLRAKLLQLSDDEYRLIFVMHHIISDGWSVMVMSNEMFALYDAYSQQRENPLPPLRIQYKDFAYTQNQMLDNTQNNSDREYWLNQFKGEIPVLELPVDKHRPAVKTFNGSFVSTVFDTKVSSELQQLGHQKGASLFVVLLTLVKTLLHRYSEQDDIIVGTTVAGREHPDLESQIGFYINMLAIRTLLTDDQSFDATLQRVNESVVQGLKHQQYPFDKLVDELDLERDPSRSPLFDVLVEFLNFKIGNSGEQQKTDGSEQSSVRPELAPYPVSKYDLSFKFDQSEKGIMAAIEYNTDLFTHEKVAQILHHLEELATSVVKDITLPLGQLSYIPPEEKELLLESFNAGSLEIDWGKSVQQLFDEQVTKSPDSVSVVFGRKSLTYSELQQAADRLAHHLKVECKILPNDIIALMLPPDEQLIIAILAILKSGAAFLPIEVDYPEKRKSYLLSDSQAKVLITKSDLIIEVGEVFTGQLYAIDIQLDQLAESDDRSAYTSNLQDLAYLMYTSGSTGTPKGVEIRHESLSNYISWANQYYFGGRACSPMGLFTSLSFDLTLTSIFSSLTRGDQLIIFDHRQLDERLRAVFATDSRVRSVKLTPSHINLLAELNMGKMLIEKVIVGGEELRPRHVEILKDLNPAVEIYNEYGPTEATIGCMIKSVDQAEEPITIGTPIANTHIYILDRNQNLKPVGVPGEICVAGKGLSSGYWQRPELTTEKFVKNPFGRSENNVLYLTGDTGKRMANGEIMMLGRTDNQVKVRGYRIETGEIEHAVSQIDLVEDVAVIPVQSEGTWELACFYTTKNTGAPDSSVLRQKLSEMIPQYMVPTFIISKESLPLTTNGKVDRNTLTQLTLAEEQEEYVAPRSETEHRLVEIWESVLSKDKIGMKDNFFKLGGHSLKAIQIVSRIHKEFDVQIAIGDIFVNPVLEDLAQKVDGSIQEEYKPIPTIAVQEYYDVSFAQKRLWVVSQFAGMQSAYNIPNTYLFEGSFDQHAFRKACEALLERHEILRTTFVQVDGHIKQKVNNAGGYGFEVAYLDLREEDNNQEKIQAWMIEKIKTPFNLEKGPLFSVNLLQVEEDKYLLLFVIHHIIYDGWSMNVIMEEVLTLYNAFSQGNENPLAPLPLQYKDYTYWQREQLMGSSLLSHRNYWMEKFKGGAPLLAFETDHPRPDMKTTAGDFVSFVLEKPLADAINELCREKEVSLFILCMAAVNALFYRYTGQEDIVIGTPVSGRSHHDLERQIGFYINNLALRTQFSREDTFETLLDKAKQTALEAYDHQVYPFDLLVEDLDLVRNTNRFPLFDILLLVENKMDEKTNVRTEDFSIEGYNSGYVVSNMDMRIVFQEIGDTIGGYVEYNVDLFKRQTIEDFVGNIINVMKEVVADNQIRIYEIEIGDRAEEQNKVEVSTQFNF